MDTESGSSVTPVLEVSPRQLPVRVNFAMDVVDWANSIEQGFSRSSHYGPEKVEGRCLSDTERSVYSSALEVIRLYLTGEMSFEEELVNKTKDDNVVEEKESVCFFCRQKPV